MRIKRVVLKHHRDVPVHRLFVIGTVAADQDVARANRFKARDHAQQGGFATARRAHDHNEFAIFDFDIDPVDHICRAKAFFDIDECDRRHGLFLAVDKAADEQPLH